MTTDRAWRDAPADVLRSLADLPALEEVRLPSAMRVVPRHLAPLQRAKQLRRLSLVGAEVTLTQALVEALRALPSLAAIELRDVALDANAIGYLRPLRLQRLDLQRCPGFNPAVFAAVCQLSSLRELGLEGLGDILLRAPHDVAWAPAAADMALLRDLPELHRLELTACTLGDAQVALLPERLGALKLYSTKGIGPEGLRHLRRLGSLRWLAVRDGGYSILNNDEDPARQALLADALGEALGTLRLVALQHHGVITPSLCDALAAQPTLVELELWPSEVPDFTSLARSPTLQHLRLINLSRLSLDDLRPLRNARRLQRLALFSCGGHSVADVRDAVGPAIEVSVTASPGLRR